MDKLRNIKKKLTRFSLEDRIGLAEYLSYRAIDSLTAFQRSGDASNLVFPWEADVIGTLALTVEKESMIKRTLFGDGFDAYSNSMLKEIDNLSFPNNYETLMGSQDVHGVMFQFMIQQKESQENAMVKAFRYWSIFNYDEKTIAGFENMTGGCDYGFYGLFACMIPCFKQVIEDEGKSGEIIGFQMFKTLMQVFLAENQKYLPAIAVDYSAIRGLQNEKGSLSDASETIFSYKVINERPFIKMDSDYFLVSPSSIPMACTDGLFISVTYHNDDFKNYVSLYAFEDYVNRIIRETSLYDTVPEDEQRKRYLKHHNELDPVDAVFKKGDAIVFIELKARVFKRRLWNYDAATVKEEYEHACVWIKQLIDRRRDFLDGYYNPFNDVTDKLKRHYLVLATLLYFPMDRDRLIKDVTKDEKYADEKEYLESNLIITDIYELELRWLYREDPIIEWAELSKAGCLRNFGGKALMLQSSKRIASFAKYIRSTNEMARAVKDKAIKAFLAKRGAK